MGMTTKELGTKLGIKDDAVARGIAAFLVGKGVLKISGERPPKGGKGRSSTEFSVTPEGKDKLNEAFTALFTT